MSTTDEAIRERLAPLLLRRHSPAERRRIAATLRALADEQERRADAEARQQARPAGDRLTPRAPHAGPGRAPSRFVRVAIEPDRTGRDRTRLYIGRGLWYELGSPARIDIQRVAGQLALRPAAGDAGYALVAGKGMPRSFCDGAADLLPPPGRYVAEVAGGAIVVGPPLV